MLSLSNPIKVNCDPGVKSGTATLLVRLVLMLIGDERLKFPPRSSQVCGEVSSGIFRIERKSE
jgi:hypothetical protein